MFGDEAINTIVQVMENHREDMVIIFAGYPDEMEQFLARLTAKQKGMRLAPDTKEKLLSAF